jgi:hypothetical protein
MPRALAILKYLPAVLCGLLVMVWVVSWLWTPSHLWSQPTVSDPGRRLGVQLRNGALWLEYWGKHSEWNGLFPPGKYYIDDEIFAYCEIPIASFAVILAPIAIGCLTRFRFPLWSYFTWTALVAAELAYYLR